MKLGTLANFSLAITNGSHQAAGTRGKTLKTKERVAKPAGIAVTSPPQLQLAVTKVCGTRRVHPGTVTALLREKCSLDTHNADERRNARMQADLDKKARGHMRKGIKFNKVNPDPYPDPLTITINQCVTLSSSCQRTWKNLWPNRNENWMPTFRS